MNKIKSKKSRQVGNKKPETPTKLPVSCKLYAHCTSIFALSEMYRTGNTLS